MPNNQKPSRRDGHAEQHRAVSESAIDEAERFRRMAEEAREVRDPTLDQMKGLEEMRQTLRDIIDLNKLRAN